MYSVAIAMREMGAGCWVLGAGCWVLLGAGCWVLGAGCWVLGAGCWVLGAGCWVLGAGCWVLGKFKKTETWIQALSGKTPYAQRKTLSIFCPSR